MARRCLFCQERASSKEHAWPQWILEWLKTDMPAMVVAQFGEGVEEVSWPSKTGEITVKYLCVKCNTGWMSQLEGFAIPHIRPLMTDFEMRLVHLAQFMIALWSVKTAMVFEGANRSKQWFYKQEERTGLMSSADLPANTVVWAGRSDITSLFVETHRLRNQPSNAQHAIGEGYASTFAVGRLVLQVMSLRSETSNDMSKVTFETRKGPWPDALVRVWPPTSSPVPKWPPKFSFGPTSTTLTELARRFRREL